MPPQARVGDSSQVPADAHGCPACPHPAIGPAIAGSPNVLTNGRPSVRVGDTGIHAACCGPNTWNAKTGSRSVLINGRKAHRLSDLVKHCGGIDQTVQGSPNVIVGDLTSGRGTQGNNDTKHKFDHGFLLCVVGTRKPIANQKYKITSSGGQLVIGVTDSNGRTARISAEAAEALTIEILEDL